MYELVILSHLMLRPAHGYLIARIINNQIGPFARLSNGRFYPLLARLEKDNLITLSNDHSEQKGDRHSNRYQITEAGRQRFYQLMLDTTSNPGEYPKIFLQKVGSLGLMPPSDQQFIIEHYITYCQAHISHLSAKRNDLAQNRVAWGLSEQFLDSKVEIIRHLIEGWELELAWVSKLYQKNFNRAESLVR